MLCSRKCDKVNKLTLAALFSLLSRVGLKSTKALETRGWVLDTHGGHSIVYCSFDPETLTFWPFGRDTVMDYPFAKFNDCIFGRFSFIVRTDGETESQTDTQTRMSSARVKPGFHYPSWRPELTARVDGWPVSITRQHRPCWRVMETGHPSTRAVNSGCQLG